MTIPGEPHFSSVRNQGMTWTTGHLIPVDIREVPDLVARAIASLAGYGVRESSAAGIMIFRRTTFALRAGSITLEYLARDEGHTLIRATSSRAYWLAGFTFGLGANDERVILNAIRAEVSQRTTPGGDVEASGV